jgi:hypothetical protein
LCIRADVHRGLLIKTMYPRDETVMLGRVLQSFYKVVDVNNVSVRVCNVAVNFWLFGDPVDLVQRSVTISLYEMTYDVG